jgi:hypothetical protein
MRKKQDSQSSEVGEECSNEERVAAKITIKRGRKGGITGQGC